MDKLPPKSETALMREMTIARPGRSQPANLRDQVSNSHNWTTPSASDSQRGGTKSATFEKNAVGQLSPNWVEWLMGWPIGWTDLTATRLIQPDWTSDPASLPADHPEYTPRVGVKIPHRAARIKCIGNGQVSLCAATAFVILSERLEACK